MRGRSIMRIPLTGRVVVAALLLASISLVHAPVRAGPIHEAAKAGDAVQVEALITAGAAVDEKDIAHKAPLH